ncbi:hypothetical protein J2Z62_000371 [Mycoplasmoides fastidiosum]|uniref:Uncharacterized protein n=1 Tax=Mycoplasmoides fastidiosum TaxID=92758 RepID=A0ABU0LZ14_9BACT|nr:hypothetical protein [Mycoplasmoides fastidiosum]MDQ0513933.1 hypothetical protein [Mycoplasmoides fastidiosum]UUD37653.1 hypothetical protein NPA10_03740 [Mycoplasmoides fastidiosum]
MNEAKKTFSFADYSNHQSQYIFKDIIVQTFTSNEDLFSILASLNNHLIKLNTTDPKPIYSNCLSIFDFDKLFAEVKMPTTKLNAQDLPLSFSQRWHLKNAYKKAVKSHAWELSKNEKMYDQIHDQLNKYIEVFLEMTKYVAVA